MEYTTLGASDVSVSRLCIGSLTVSPVQANLPPERAAEVLAYAFSRGVSFTDTAQYYENYPLIRRALELYKGDDVVISTKTYAYTREMAIEAVEEARRELNRDVIDIFMLHEQESYETLRGHREALEYLFECKAKGVIRAVGASMHHVAAVEGVIELARRGVTLDVIHPIFNRGGYGIADGTIAEMESAVSRAHDLGIGVFAMKVLGGGHLFREASEAFDFALSKPYIDAIAVGMQSEAEIDANIAYFETRSFPEAAKVALSEKTRRLHIEDYCEGCGACVSRCAQGALSVIDGHASVDMGKCVLCGYCSRVCPLFAIKVL